MKRFQENLGTTIFDLNSWNGYSLNLPPCISMNNNDNCYCNHKPQGISYVIGTEVRGKNANVRRWCARVLACEVVYFKWKQPRPLMERCRRFLDSYLPFRAYNNSTLRITHSKSSFPPAWSGFIGFSTTKYIATTAALVIIITPRHALRPQQSKSSIQQQFNISWKSPKPS
jgi:hypothetical protein